MLGLQFFHFLECIFCIPFLQHCHDSVNDKNCQNDDWLDKCSDCTLQTHCVDIKICVHVAYVSSQYQRKTKENSCNKPRPLCFNSSKQASTNDNAAAASKIIFSMSSNCSSTSSSRDFGGATSSSFLPFFCAALFITSSLPSLCRVPRLS